MFRSGKWARIGGLGAILSVALLASGCIATNKSHPNGYIGGVTLQEMKRSEYTVGKAIEGSAEVTTILFFIKLGNNTWGKIAGAGPAPLMLPGPLGLLMGSGKNATSAATYNLIQKAGTADAILPIASTVTVEGFGGLYNVERATVRARTIKLK